MSDDPLDEYWKALADEERRRGQLELYRSEDFEQLSDYRLADLSVPLLILWDTRVVVIDGAPHFVWDEVPEVCVAALTTFLARIRSSSGSST
jgi:haloalkane dehalogenase